MQIVKTISIYKEVDPNGNVHNQYHYDHPKYNNPYIQVNDVRYTDEGQAVVEAGRPLTTTEAEKIFRAINAGEDINKPCLLPANVLMWHRDSNAKGYRCLFYEKSKIRPLYHSSLDDPIYVPWPSLVFSVTQTGISAYAIKNKRKRPDKNTKLYHAPLFNTYSGGSICMGNCRMDNHSTPEDAINAWCSFMFDSKFTNEVGGEYGSCSELLEFWEKLDGKDTFPNDILRPFRKNLGDII